MIEKLEIKANLTVSEKGEISGIAWPHNAGRDQYGDAITPGAFNIAVDDLPMLLGHDPENIVGLWSEVKETPAGLEVRGKLFIDNDRAKAVRSMITTGLIAGLSIGYRTKAFTGTPGKNRVISALDLLEVSIVRNPAHPRARITAVKSAEAAKALKLAEVLKQAAQAFRS